MHTDFMPSRLRHQVLKHRARVAIAALAVAASVLAHAATETAEPSANNCASAATQADMNRCAYEDFEASGSGYALRYKELSQPLPSAQRDRLRRMQSAWLKFRTEACRYESGPSTGGSVQEFIYWRCAARMTRERTLALQALAACREGDGIAVSRGPIFFLLKTDRVIKRGKIRCKAISCRASWKIRTNKNRKNWLDQCASPSQQSSRPD